MLLINKTTTNTESPAQTATGTIQVQVSGLKEAKVKLEVSQDSLPMTYADTVSKDGIANYQLAAGCAYRFRVVGIGPDEAVSVSVLES
ncbi:hypothetical protein [Endozoicomonas sp. ALC066]|uniref:hypothetical protein n=1 Tax=Endozoicomonas sp. ALC066 TaxID=3403078 RepID=UPI003BB67C4D